MNFRFLSRAFLLSFLSAVLSGAAYSAIAQAQRPFTVVLDSGHSPSSPGALGARGLYEVAYNDILVGQIAQRLRAVGVRVQVTRLPAQDASLEQRIALANTTAGDLFLSIHHDSAQPQLLTATTYDGRKAFATTRPIRGYSAFVSKRNPQFERSFEFARIVANSLNAIGRQPTMHHAETIAGESRELLDTALGVYRYDGLFVLRKTTMASVLLEVGVIVDATDEAVISNNANRDLIVNAIVISILQFARSKN